MKQRRLHITYSPICKWWLQYNPTRNDVNQSVARRTYTNNLIQVSGECQVMAAMRQATGMAANAQAGEKAFVVNLPNDTAGYSAAIEKCRHAAQEELRYRQRQANPYKAVWCRGRYYSDDADNSLYHGHPCQRLMPRRGQNDASGQRLCHLHELTNGENCQKDSDISKLGAHPERSMAARRIRDTTPETGLRMRNTFRLL